MVKEAETFAEEDNKRKEFAEIRNKADNLVYTTEKSLKDFGNKVSEGDKKAIEEKLKNLKELIKKEGVTKEELEKSMEDLTQASYKLAEEVYKSTAQQQTGAQPGAQPGAGEEPKGKEEPEQEKAKEDEVIDAEFKEENNK
jgi:molecular chaperone DnaK